MTMTHQIGNISKEKEIAKKNQMEILDLKSTITKMKSPLQGLNSRYELGEEIISNLEHRLIEIMQSKRKQNET